MTAIAPVVPDLGADLPAPPVRKRRTPWRFILLFLAPGIIIYAGFVLAPLIQAAVFSLFEWNGLGPLSEFVGFENYLTAITDPTLQRSLLNNTLVIVFSIVVQMPLALWIATMLHGEFRGRGLFRVVFLIPYIISEVVTAVLWTMMLNPTGAINESLNAVGLGFLAHSWLADPSTVMTVLLFVILWKYFGFYTLLYLAALQAVPQELLEAARMDGASRWQVFRAVTLPMIGPTVRIAIFLSTVGALQLFDIVWVMTKGGPVGASSTLVTYMISTGIDSYRVGYASAVAMIVAVIAFTFALLYQRFVLSRDNDEEKAL